MQGLQAIQGRRQRHRPVRHRAELWPLPRQHLRNAGLIGASRVDRGHRTLPRHHGEQQPDLTEGSRQRQAAMHVARFEFRAQRIRQQLEKAELEHIHGRIGPCEVRNQVEQLRALVTRQAPQRRKQLQQRRQAQVRGQCIDRRLYGIDLLHRIHAESGTEHRLDHLALTCAQHGRPRQQQSKRQRAGASGRFGELAQLDRQLDANRSGLGHVGCGCIPDRRRHGSRHHGDTALVHARGQLLEIRLKSQLAHGARRDLIDKRHIEAGIERADTFGQWRMGREHPLQTRCKQHVRDLLGLRLLQSTALSDAGDLQQRTLQALGIAGELDRGRIRKPLAPPADRRLDHPAADAPEPADDRKRRPDQEQVRTALAAAPARRMPEDQTTHQCDEHQPEQPADQAQIQAHVAIQDVAELVRDHTLEFVAIQALNRATRDGDGRVGRRVPRSERVDRRFVLENVHLGHRHTRRDRHLLHDVVQALQPRILGVALDSHTAERRRDGPAAIPQLHRAKRAGAPDDEQPEQRSSRREAGVAGGPCSLRGPLAEEDHDQNGQRTDDQRDRERERDDQPACAAPGRSLAGIEIHRCADLPVSRS